ncbi:signal recognition particle subunit srp68, partial [Massospora cicadina]
PSRIKIRDPWERAWPGASTLLFLSRGGEMPHKIEFRALNLITEARNTFGIRHQDFTRYSSPTNPVSYPFYFPWGFVFRNTRGLMGASTLKGYGSNLNYLNTPIYLGFGYRMPALQGGGAGLGRRFEAKCDPNREARKRYAVVGRLRRACILAATLARACAWVVLDDVSKLEIKVYIWILNGLHTSEREQWQASKDFFAAASEVLNRLAQWAAVPAQDKALYLSFLDELEPSLRFCEYHLSNPMEVGDLAELLSTVAKELGSVSTPVKSGEFPSSLLWFGSEIWLPSSELSRLAFHAHQAEAAIASDLASDTAMLPFDELVGAYAEMAQAANKLLEANRQLAAAKTLSSRGAEIAANLHRLQACAEQRYRTGIILRNWCLAKATFSIHRGTRVPQLTCTGRVEVVAQLTEKALQALEEISRLPAFEEDYRFEQWVLSNGSFFKAFRLVFIGMKYAGNHEFAKAFALFERAHELFLQAKGFKAQAVQSTARIDSLITLDELEVWAALSRSQAHQAHAHYALDYAQAYSDVLEGASTLGFRGTPAPEPVALNLKRFPRFKAVAPAGPLSSPVQPPLFGFEPPLRPTPCKPIAFDVASKAFAHGGSTHRAMVARLAERAGIAGPEIAQPTGSGRGLGGSYPRSLARSEAYLTHPTPSNVLRRGCSAGGLG